MAALMPMRPSTPAVRVSNCPITNHKYRKAPSTRKNHHAIWVRARLNGLRPDSGKGPGWRMMSLCLASTTKPTNNVRKTTPTVPSRDMEVMTRLMSFLPKGTVLSPRVSASVIRRDSINVDLASSALQAATFSGTSSLRRSRKLSLFSLARSP